MSQKFFSFLKKILFSGFLLYGYNLFAYQFNVIIPINIITLSIVSIFGAPGLIALAVFKLIV